MFEESPIQSNDFKYQCVVLCSRTVRIHMFSMTASDLSFNARHRRMARKKDRIPS